MGMGHVAFAPADWQLVGIADVQNLGAVAADPLLEAEWESHSCLLSQTAMLHGTDEIVSKRSADKPGVIRQHFGNGVVDEQTHAVVERLLDRKNARVPVGILAHGLNVFNCLVLRIGPERLE